MPNRLATETSPYLLQHKDNPVDWHPWDEQALATAKSQDKPIFLSIGYSACHWCHVMEHESFEDEQIAALLNEHFVCIKVDREERPDLDQIYMTAVQLMTGRGGWPMSMFLTPDLQPYFGGTYWPPTARSGMPGFDQVVAAVADAWKQRRDQALEQASKITAHIGQATQLNREHQADLSVELLIAAATQFERRFDFTHGGFGQAPKFPQPMGLEFLLHLAHRTGNDAPLEMVRLNLDKMAAGGIYDQLGGGFARYSVDERWLAPHFEKMLYDNALLAHVYLDAYLMTGASRYGEVVAETLDYVLALMTDQHGGFYSTEDADSEGVEGKFYVWSLAEIQELLGDQRCEKFAYVYDVTEGGNFDGHNILNLPKTIEQCAAIKGWELAQLRAELAECRGILLAHRNGRVRPGLDDKVLVNWNGLMIRAMARAGAILPRPQFVTAAQRAADFVLAQMRNSAGRLFHSWRNGEAKFNAYLDDYASLAAGLVALYEATHDERWIAEAVALVEIVLKHFADMGAAGYFYTSDDHPQLIARIKDMHDNATPCGNALFATALIDLGRICGRQEFLDIATSMLAEASALMVQSPLAAGQWLVAVDKMLGPAREVVLVGEDVAEVEELLQSLRGRYAPHTKILVRHANAETASLLDGMFEARAAVDGVTTAYVCEQSVCGAPLVGSETIRAELLGNSSAI